MFGSFQLQKIFTDYLKLISDKFVSLEVKIQIVTNCKLHYIRDFGLKV